MNRTQDSSSPLLTIYVLIGSDQLANIRESITSITQQIHGLPIIAVASINNPRIDASQLQDLDPALKMLHHVERVPSWRHTELCAAHCRSPYIMAFHDDDLIAPGYLSFLIQLLTQANPPALVTTDMRFFCGEPGELWRSHQHYRMASLNRSQLALRMFRGDAVNFASCTYRTTALQAQHLQQLSEQFGKYGDRPLMLNCVADGDTLIHVQGGAVLTRVHGLQDSVQTDPMAAKHRPALLGYYGSVIRERRRFNMLLPYAAWRSLHDCLPNKERLKLLLKLQDRPLFCLALGLPLAVLKILVEKSRAGLGPWLKQGQTKAL